MSTDSQSAMDQPSTSSGDLAGLASQFVGPMIIGTFFSFMLNGVLLMQTHGYWRRFRETDATWIVGLVAFTVSIALASGGIAGYLSYYYGVLHFGDVEEMFHEINQFSVLVVCISTCSAPVQFFFGWRVKRLTGQRWLLWLAIAAGIVEITCGIGTVVYGTPLHDFRKFAQLRGWVIAWDGTASITDLIITVVLVNHLRKNRTGIRSTDDMLRRIERLTIQTGLITAVAASVALGLFSGINNNVSFAVNAALPPLYANVLLSALNARQEWGEMLHTAPKPQVNHVLSHGPYIINGRSRPTSRIMGFQRSIDKGPNSAEYWTDMLASQAGDPKSDNIFRFGTVSSWSSGSGTPPMSRAPSRTATVILSSFPSPPPGSLKGSEDGSHDAKSPANAPPYQTPSLHQSDSERPTSPPVVYIGHRDNNDGADTTHYYPPGSPPSTQLPNTYTPRSSHRPRTLASPPPSRPMSPNSSLSIFYPNNPLLPPLQPASVATATPIAVNPHPDDFDPSQSPVREPSDPAVTGRQPWNLTRGEDTPKFDPATAAATLAARAREGSGGHYDREVWEV